MQIHELTAKKQIEEGFMDQLKLAGKAFSDPSILHSNPKFASAQADIKLQAATKDTVKRLAGEWMQQAKNIAPPSRADIAARAGLNTTKQPAAAKPAGTPPAAAKLPAPTATATQKSTGGAGAFSQMANQLTSGGTPSTAAATPATTPAAATPAPTGPISIGGQKLNPKNPKDAKLIAQLKAKGLKEAFADLPGAKPQAGAPMKQDKAGQFKTAQTLATRNNIRTSFENWVNSKISTKEQTTGTPIDLNVLKQDPKLKAQLQQLSTAVVNTQQDPQANQKAVEAYLTTAITAMQAKAKELRQPGNVMKGTMKSTGNPAADQDLIKSGWTITK